MSQKIHIKEMKTKIIMKQANKNFEWVVLTTKKIAVQHKFQDKSSKILLKNYPDIIKKK